MEGSHLLAEVTREMNSFILSEAASASPSNFTPRVILSCPLLRFLTPREDIIKGALPADVFMTHWQPSIAYINYDHVDYVIVQHRAGWKDAVEPVAVPRDVLFYF